MLFPCHNLGFGIICTYQLTGGGGGGEGGLRSFDIWGGSHPTEQILPGMDEKMNSIKNKNGHGKNFLRAYS